MFWAFGKTVPIHITRLDIHRDDQLGSKVIAITEFDRLL
jgi:hypothetical protein